MEFVKIGCPGNRPDRIMYGCVPYEYEMAKCQLTNAEWCEFLSAIGVERSFALHLWHKDMMTGVLGGVDKGEKFTCKPGWEKKPVVYVDYLSLCRYCNWLTSGDIERGSYDLSGDVPRRIVGAKYFLPNDAEWYKAAYFDPKTRRYWPYPTQGRVNYEKGDELAEGPPYYFADVDDYADSPSPWGVIQMGGNAWEMLEDVVEVKVKARGEDEQRRVLNTYRGGSFGYTETGLSKLNIDTSPYGSRCYVFGARIARMESGWRPHKLPLQYGIIQLIYKSLRECKRFVRKLLSLVRS